MDRDWLTIVQQLGVPAVLLISASALQVTAAVALWRALRDATARTADVYDRWLADKDREIERLRATRGCDPC